jgi:hypothetical protein
MRSKPAVHGDLAVDFMEDFIDISGTKIGANYHHISGQSYDYSGWWDTSPLKKISQLEG